MSKSSNSYLAADKAEAKYIFTVSKSQTGAYSVDGYIMEYDDTTKAWTTNNYKTSSGDATFSVDANTKVRTFNFTLNSVDYALSEANGDYTFVADGDDVYPVSDTTLGKATKNYLASHTSHNVTAMKHYGMTVIGSAANSGAAAGIAKSHFHYEECADCGLKYYKKTVTVESNTTDFDSNGLCKVCGAAKDATDWVDLKITSTNLAAKEQLFIMKTGSAVTLPEGKYTKFNGKSYDIKENTLWTLNSGMGVSGDKVIVSATGATATFVDAT